MADGGICSAMGFEGGGRIIESCLQLGTIASKQVMPHMRSESVNTAVLHKLDLPDWHQPQTLERGSRE